MFELIRTFNGIDFDVRFENKVNLFSGLSGEGKTFLFTVLEDYFMLNDINYQYYNSDSLRFGIRELISGCDGKKIIIFDNADLYLTQELLDYAVNIADTLIISMKVYCKLKFTDYDLYEVNYNDNRLVVRKEDEI